MEIGLSYIRKLYNYSMQDLGTALRISKQTVSKWENNQKPIPEERITQLSKLFDVDKEYFSRTLYETDKIFLQANKLANEIGGGKNDRDKYIEVIEDFCLNKEFILSKVKNTLGKSQVNCNSNIMIEMQLKLLKIAYSNENAILMLEKFLNAISIAYDLNTTGERSDEFTKKIVELIKDYMGNKTQQ